MVFSAALYFMFDVVGGSPRSLAIMPVDVSNRFYEVVENALLFVFDEEYGVCTTAQF